MTKTVRLLKPSCGGFYRKIGLDSEEQAGYCRIKEEFQIKKGTVWLKRVICS